MDNSTTFDYQLNQFAAWYLFTGIVEHLDYVDMVCQCETLLEELDRLEAWEQAHGGFYGYEYVPARFAELRERIVERRDFIEAADERYYAEREARERRESFTVVEGGLSGNLSQAGINE